MFLFLLPVSGDPYQIMYLSVSPDNQSFLAKVELRYLPAPDRWFLSVSDAATGKEYVNLPQRSFLSLPPPLPGRRHRLLLRRESRGYSVNAGSVGKESLRVPPSLDGPVPGVMKQGSDSI